MEYECEYCYLLIEDFRSLNQQGRESLYETIGKITQMGGYGYLYDLISTIEDRHLIKMIFDVLLHYLDRKKIKCLISRVKCCKLRFYLRRNIVN